MTYSDIYTKFLIEYDKANVTSSYPSLTVYEIATVLDKACLAIIAQKLTGNNYRRSTFESDIKAIEDLRPLLNESTLSKVAEPSTISNRIKYSLSNIDSFLYYISSKIEHTVNGNTNYDNVSLVTRNIADKYAVTSYNIPWMENPVCYIEDSNICVYVDGYNVDLTKYSNLIVTYIKRPTPFIGTDDKTKFDDTTFVLNDTMVEEMINLAIIMALEEVESPRLKTKEQTNTLES